MQIIYIDILFFINFLMDIFIFITASLLLSRQIVLRKIFVASFMASVMYCFIVIVPSLQSLPFNLYYLILPCIPIIYLFKPITLRKFFEVYIVNIIVASIIGGLSFNMYYQASYIYNEQVSIIVPIITGAVITLLTYHFITFIRKRILLLPYEAKVTLNIDNNVITLEGIVDTGNMLYTVFSKRPVTVVAMDKIEKYLTHEIKEFINKLETTDNVIDILPDTNKSIQLIPFDSVGCKNGMLVAIKVQEITISRGDIVYGYNEAMVALCKLKVFKDDSYSVLIHPDLVN